VHQTETARFWLGNRKQWDTFWWTGALKIWETESWHYRSFAVVEINAHRFLNYLHWQMLCSAYLQHLLRVIYRQRTTIISFPRERERFGLSTWLDEKHSLIWLCNLRLCIRLFTSKVERTSNRLKEQITDKQTEIDRQTDRQTGLNKIYQTYVSINTVLILQTTTARQQSHKIFYV